MTTRCPSGSALLGVALALALTLPTGRADDPKPPAKAEALPKGAILRLGGDRPGGRYAPQFALLPSDFKTFVVPDVNGRLRRFDVGTGRPLDKDPPPPGATPGTGGQVVFSADGKRYIAVRTGILVVRDLANADVIAEIKPPQGFSTVYYGGAASAALSANGKVMAQGGQGQNAKAELLVWDVDKGTVLHRLSPGHNGPPIPAVSADGKLVASRPANPGYGAPTVDKGEPDPARTVTVWDATTGKEVFKGRVTGAGTQAAVPAFSPDGTLLAAGVADGPVDVWDVKQGKAKFALLGRTGQGLRVAFSPDSKTLAAVATDGTIQRWATADGKLVGTTDGPAELQLGAVQGIAFAGNERVVAWGVAGVVPLVWEAPSGKVLTALPEHTAGIKSVAFAAGGKEVVTAGLDGRVIRWDAATGKPLGPITLRGGRATAGYAGRLVLTLSPDGTQGVSTAYPAVVFDLTTGREEIALPRGGPVNDSFAGAPTADGSKYVTISGPYNGARPATCVVWDLVGRKKIFETELSAALGASPAAAVSPSGERLVLAWMARDPGAGRQVVRVAGWELKSGKKLGEAEDPTATGTLHIAAASETSAVLSSNSGRLRAFDFEVGRVGEDIETTRPVVGGTAENAPVVFNADGTAFFAGVATEQGVYGVRAYDWPRAKTLHSFAGHRAPVSALTLSPDGKTLAAGAQDGTVILWDVSKVGR